MKLDLSRIMTIKLYGMTDSLLFRYWGEIPEEGDNYYEPEEFHRVKEQAFIGSLPRLYRSKMKVYQVMRDMEDPRAVSFNLMKPNNKYFGSDPRAYYEG